MTATRRLAAIVVADVVGYSRLMEADEAGTLAAMEERYKSVLEPTVREFGGRIVKSMGDGVLVEFASAVNAVKGAVELQARMAGANESVAEDRRIMLRIGINLGDVIGEGGDIFGDGVNIASRLEALAEPGGICVSAKVHEEARGKVEAAFEDIGEQQLKNLAAPVRAHRWRPNGVAASVPVSDPGKPSIAVLPFVNMSGDPEQQYFSDGITEDIITELARFRHLNVVARNASFRHRGADLDLMRVGRELNAAYLVEGSVRKLGPRIRITAQLIDAKSGHHLWAEKFDRAQDELFAVQDEVVRTVVATLSGRLLAAGIEGSKRKPPASLTAYECVLRADALPFDTPEACLEARRLYERAIALDPGYARAHALLATNLNVEWEIAYERDDRNAPGHLLDAALEHAMKAVALDENDSVCQGALGLIHLVRHSHALAEHHFRRALQLNPNRVSLVASYGSMCAYAGRAVEGIEYFKEARRLDPHFEPSWYWPALGTAHFVAGQNRDAIEAFARAPRLWLSAHCFLAASCAMAGEAERVRESVAAILGLAPHFSRARFVAREPFKREEDRQHLIEGLRKAGLPD